MTTFLNVFLNCMLEKNQKVGIVGVTIQKNLIKIVFKKNLHFIKSTKTKTMNKNLKKQFKKWEIDQYYKQYFKEYFKKKSTKTND